MNNIVAELNANYDACESAIPGKNLDFERVFPDAQLNLLFNFITVQARILSEELSNYEFDFLPILFLCACRSYLHTQYLYTERLTPTHVNLDDLVSKFDENDDFLIQLFLPPKLDFILQKVTSNLKEEFERKYDKSAIRFLKTKDLMERFYLRLTASSVIGALVWQTAESLTAKPPIENLKMPKVFISYSSRDKIKVAQIERKLNKSGIKTWLDQKDIKVGEHLLDRIKTGIWEECDFILVILSQNSINSNWCKFEIRMAHEREMSTGEIFLLPIVIDTCDIPKELSIKKYLDFSKNMKKIEELVKGIAGHYSFKRKN